MMKSKRLKRPGSRGWGPSKTNSLRKILKHYRSFENDFLYSGAKSFYSIKMIDCNREAFGLCDKKVIRICCMRLLCYRSKLPAS